MNHKPRITKPMNTMTSFLCLGMTAMFVSPLNAQPYTLDSSPSPGGGWTQSTAGGFLLSSTISLPAADTAIAGTYRLQGGFGPAFQKVVGPALRLQGASGSFLASWPASCQGFVLEGAASAYPARWESLGDGFAFGGDRVVAIAANSGLH